MKLQPFCYVFHSSFRYVNSLEMKMTVENIYDSSKNFYFVLKFLGLAPYTFDRKTQSLRINNLSVIVFIVSLLIAIILFIVQIRIGNYGSDNKWGLLGNIWQMQYLLQNFFVFPTLIFNFLKVKSLDKLLKSIDSFDMKIESLSWNFEVRLKLTHRVLLVFCFTLLFMITYGIVSLFFLEEIYSKSKIDVVIIYKLLNYTAVTLFFLALYVQFIVSVNAIRTRLSVLIKNIR